MGELTQPGTGFIRLPKLLHYILLIVNLANKTE